MLETPAHSNGGPEVLDESFVRVNSGGNDRHNVWQSIEETGQELSSNIRDASKVREQRIGVFRVTRKDIVAVGFGREGNVHMPRITGKTLARFGHKARRDAVLAADALRG